MTRAETVRAADVRLIELTKRFDDVVAVDSLSLEIEHGAFFALLGPSGCGKTTTLRMIGGFEEPTAGRIELDDRDVSGLPPYRRDVNTVFQSYALFPHLTVFENVAFGLRRKKIRGDQLRERVVEALELVGLAGLERRKPRQLSGGQQQRIALARALVNRPRVLLLDEPLGALDLKLRKEMQLELKRIQHDVGITFVHVTHDQEEAMTMADRIVIMNHGRIEQFGTPTELYEQPRTAFVAGFLGVSNLLRGDVVGPDRVRLADGTEVEAPLGGRTGAVHIGVRPEKLRLGSADMEERRVSMSPPPFASDFGGYAPGGNERNSLVGAVTESAYIGVSTQFIVETPAGDVSVYVQNDRPGAHAVAPGDRVTLSWSPDCTFVVDAEEAD